jgi:hypothetical protein
VRASATEKESSEEVSMLLRSSFASFKLAVDTRRVDTRVHSNVMEWMFLWFDSEVRILLFSVLSFLENPSPRKWFHTIPVIVDPGHLTPTGDPIVVCDSWAIAEYLTRFIPIKTFYFHPVPKPSKRSLLTTL